MNQYILTCKRCNSQIIVPYVWTVPRIALDLDESQACPMAHRLARLDDYSEAELVAARVRALHTQVAKLKQGRWYQRLWAWVLS